MSLPSLSTPPAGPILVCGSGPDQGKRLVLTEHETTLGRATDCPLLSDDPDVAGHHVALWLKAGEPAYRPLADATVFVDGHLAPEGPIRAVQQLRVGRSSWQLAAGAAGGPPEGWIERVSERITSATGLEKVRGFSPAAMFSEAFKKRLAEEIEDYLDDQCCGAAAVRGRTHHRISTPRRPPGPSHPTHGDHGRAGRRVVVHRP